MHWQQSVYKFLHWTERWTKTDMVYLASGGFWLTLGQVVSSLSSLILSIAFANLLPKETYGVYRFILSMGSLLAIPTLSGMSTAIIQAIARGYEGSFVLALKAKIKWGLMGSLAGLGLAGYYYWQGDIVLTLSFLVSAVFLPFMDSVDLYDSLLIGKKLFRLSTKYGTVIKVLATLVMILTLFLTKNVILIVLTYFSAYTILRLLFLIITLKKFKPNKIEDVETVSFGKHLSLMDAINTIAAQLDKILVFSYLGATELAIYSFAISPPEQLKGILKNIKPLALPKFAEKSREQIKKTITLKTIRFAFLLALIGFAYIIAAPYIFKIFFPQYLTSVVYSQVFAISLITGASTLPQTALQSQKAKKELYKLNIYSQVINIIILFIFINYYGLMGMVLARVLNRFIGFGLSLSFIKKI